MLSTISLGAFVSAQVQLNQLTEFGTAIYDINDQGKGIHGNGYYDFATNTSSATEDGVAQTSSINNDEQVLGLLIDGENFIPAMRNSGTWAALANLDETYTYTLHAMSENGVYVVGQTDWTVETGAWGFIYNTETETLTILDSPLYEYGAAYGVNNEGIAVGWVDDLPTGTVRMPAYFDEEGNITLISENYGEGYAINSNNEIVGNLEGVPFMYKIAGEELTSYELPTDYLSAAFTDISENGIAVGYAETFIEGQGGLRMPIIFHPSLGAQPQLFKEFLEEQGVDTSTLDGQASKISPDGKYIAGWTSGPAFFALGWSVYLDDAIMGVSDLNNSDLTLYPNPVKDILNFNSKKQIQNISAYNVAGQQVINAKATNGKLNVASLAPGVYVFKITLEGGKTETFKIIKK